MARLLLLPEAAETARTIGGDGAAVTWHLHPPMLAAIRRGSEGSVGGWGRPAMVALRASKRLRGTRFDPFGRTEMRRLERALPEEYTAAVDEVSGLLTAENLSDAVAIANLPDGVRGYEDLKLRRAAEFRSALSEAVARFGSPARPSPATTDRPA